MTSGTHALILAQSAFEAVCKERDEALALLASEKSTRNAIIAKCVEMEKQLEAMREAIKEAYEALDNCIEFINDAQIIEAQWHWEPVKQSKAALAKLKPLLP